MEKLIKTIVHGRSFNGAIKGFILIKTVRNVITYESCIVEALIILVAWRTAEHTIITSGSCDL